MPDTYSCALCGYYDEFDIVEPVPVSITEPHHDPRDGLLCLRTQLDRNEATDAG